MSAIIVRLHIGRAATLVVMALCLWMFIVPVGANATEPLNIAKFTLQTTKSIELPGTQEKLESAKQHDELTAFSHESYGFENQPVSFTQAAAHPNGQNEGADSITAFMEFDHKEVQIAGSGATTEYGPVPTGDPKDISVVLPPGLLGNPTAVPRCSLKKALAIGTGPCPSSTQVGIEVVHLAHGEALAGPIVNVVPEVGQSAEFVVETSTNVNFVLTAHLVQTSKGYAVTVVSNGVPNDQIVSVESTFWGVPAAEVHDAERGLFCSRGVGQSGPEPWGCGFVVLGFDNNKEIGLGLEKSDQAPTPFLTMPADCTMGPGAAVMKADSWEEPGVYKAATSYIGGATGCSLLQFAPGIQVIPDTWLADAPVGPEVTLSVPQFEAWERLATPQLRNAEVTLPLGMSVSPGIVDGLQACNTFRSEGDAIEIPSGLNENHEPLEPNEIGREGEEQGPSGEPQLAPGKCPNASTVGTAEAITPLLSSPVKGHVYLARPNCGDETRGQASCSQQDALDGNLYKLYLELGGTGELANAGVNIKVPLKVEVNPATGQLTTVAEDNPQLPFSQLKIRLNGGPRAALDNPPVCGTAVTTASFSSWAAPGSISEEGGPDNGVFVPGVSDATSSSSFGVDLAGDGEATPCGNLSLHPGFVGGTEKPNAGKFSAFTMTISRKDREQYIKGIQVHLPPGLLGVLANVPLCPEVQADDPAVYGECRASLIGTVRVASGAGSHPFEIEGKMYLTGPHDGAPFGLSIVTPAVAGPFHLGLVVVRARINVDSTTSALTVTTDEAGPYALPQIWMGVPLRLQRITVNVDRSRFMFNPTNCKARQIVVSVAGNQQTVASASSRFAVEGCENLTFKPKFAVSTSAHTGRRIGASLDARVSYPKGAMGKYANIAYVKVSLPRQLPSFLATLQKACPVRTFQTDPAGCARGSVVGIARTSTPLLPVQLVGPVYFVSFGGEAFPQLVVVLQGDGVRVDLVGSTFIRRGITSSTFRTVPDVPVTSFELYLPQGRNHALSANGNLCKEAGKLVMPTTFRAQNGVVIRQNTRIAVKGCRPRASDRLERRGHPTRHVGR